MLMAQDCCEAQSIAENECGGIGCYIPQCTDECEWELMQCWNSTGYCWCVDGNGIEIEGTSTPSWQGYPDCENQNNCIDGEINLDNPCNPIECIDGEWIEIIIDCAEDFGVPCNGGTSPAIVRKRVVFPIPEGPAIATISPFENFKLIEESKGSFDE